MKISEIQELIKFVAKSGVSEVEIEDKDFKINIKTPASKKGKGAADAAVMPQQMMAQPQMVQPQYAPQPQAAPQQAAPAAPSGPSAEEKKAAKEEEKYVSIKSPMIGTFYRSPSPDKPQFVKVGDTIKAGDVVCIIEAMKLFNEIEAEVSGKVVKVLVDDTTPVEYDQPLILIDPS